MPTYKLIYFDGRGRAEVCRLLLTLAGQKFEDVRITREEWPNVKPTTPFGQVPVLEIDGKPFGESVALESYLAREFGYYGKTNLEMLQIDQVEQLVMDFIQAAVKGMLEKDEAKRAELGKLFEEEEAPKFLGYFEKLLKENGTGYFVGDSLTLADLSVYNFSYGMNIRVPGFLDKFPLVKALVERVEGNEKLKSYLADRKLTDF